MLDFKRLTRHNPYIIAEIGMNHDGSFGNALRLMEEAKRSGVQAVKFQWHIAEAESLPKAPRPPFFQHEDRSEYFERTAFTDDEWLKLRRLARKFGMHFIVSPFSILAAHKCARLGVDAMKIASGEVSNLPLLRYLRRQPIPVILSSGMSNWSEIQRAAKALGNKMAVLFQCSSQYPAEARTVGLNVIVEMVKRYPRAVIGYSDHTPGLAAAVCAYGAGARIFEKHFTLSKLMYGPDARLSLQPQEMSQYVDEIQFAAQAHRLPVNKNNLTPYRIMRQVFEKGIVAARRLPAGTVLVMKDLDFKKPVVGMRADQFEKVIGRSLRRGLKKDQPIKASDIGL